MKFGLSKDIYNKIKNVVLKYSSYEFKIYGSRARGDFKKESDVDIAVFGNINEEDSYEIKRPSRKVDFETVRNKAFGSLTDDIRNNLCENCELYKEVKITKNADKKLLSDDDNLLSDMTKDDVKDVTLEEAEDNYFDFGVDYEIPKRKKSQV